MIQDIISRNESAEAGQKELEVLKATFPQCFDRDGNFNKDKFLSSLPNGVKITDETSGFNWLGKNYARMLTNMDTTTVICPDTEHNDKPENRDSQNIYISGDNLDALQHLVKSYSGQVKVIYIDPPYNTGSDGFVYNDKFKFSTEELASKLGIDIEQADRILSMTRRGSASHAAWLTFMLPRLSFARDLLTKDGVIFISIDDNEQANLKLLCDDIFGEENFIADIIWKHTQQSKNDELHFARMFNHTICYAKNKDLLPSFNLERSESDNVNYSNPDNDPKGKWRSGDVRSPSYRKTLCYDIIAPNGSVIKAPDNGWRWSEDTIQEKIRSGEIIFKKDYSGIIRKIYLVDQEGRTPENVWNNDKFGSTRQAAAEIKELFDGIQVFETPKPTSLIRGILNLLDTSDSLIVDFFGGSSTTAHACMLDKENYGNRRYILVQLPEPCKKDSEAAKAGYKTIDEIGMERIKRAAAKIKADNPLFAGDLGFKHYTLKEPSQHTLDKLENFSKDAALFGDDDILKEFGSDAVLRTWLVADNYGLTAEPEKLMLGNYEAYYIQHHLYLINPDRDFNEESMAALMDKYIGGTFSPQNVVVFGYSFGSANRIMLESNLRSLSAGNKSLQVTIDVRY